MRLNREALRSKIERQKRSALRLPSRLAHGAHVVSQILYWTATLQLRAGLRRKRETRLIRNSDLFDRHHYLAQCAGDPAAERDPVQHYILVGAARGLDPSPLFDSSAYAERNGAAMARGENPLAHFIRSRARAGVDAAAPDAPRSASAPVQEGYPWRARPFRAAAEMRSILVVHPRLPGPGPEDRVLAVLERLREMGYAVAFLGWDERAPAARAEALERLGITVRLGLEAGVEHLASQGHAYGLALLAGTEPAFRLLPAIRAYATHATVIYDREALLPTGGEDAGDRSAGSRSEHVARMAEVTSRCADAVWIPGDAHRDGLARDLPDARVRVVPDAGHLASALAACAPGVAAPFEDVDAGAEEPRTASVAARRDGERAGRSRGSVLVVGVYLADVEHNAVEIARELGRAEEWEVEQRWIALGNSAQPQELAAITAWTQRSRVAKFVLLNRLLAKLDLERHDFVLVTDDDISLPERFVDSYLELVTRHDLALAQPARTHDSFTDNWIVERLDGLAARRTRFVEIGPLFSMRRDAVRLMTPFDETSPMGWALDFFWPILLEKAGLRMGIVDATPVAHDMRKPVALYDNRDAAIAMRAFLASRPHLSTHDAFSILEAYA